MAEEYDGPWKEILERYLEPALQLLYPKTYSVIDWSRGYESLEQELLRITPEGESDPTAVDKLIRVWTKKGKSRILYIHIEIQAQVRKQFPKRMFLYQVRILEAYGEHPRSLAILADGSRKWRPTDYRFRNGGTRGRFVFEPVKLLDFESRMEELEQSSNPFAVMIETHLKTLRTRKNPARRRTEKLAIVKSLRSRGFAMDEVRNLFRFLDWMMKLPPHLDRPWWEDVHSYQKEQGMPFVDWIERSAIEKGLHRAVVAVSRNRFGEQPEIETRIRKIYDESALVDLNVLLSQGVTLEEVRQRLDTIPGS